MLIAPTLLLSDPHQEICDGLTTVQTTLETFHTILPEKIFFWLRADWAIIWTFGVGLFTVGTVIYRQVVLHSARDLSRSAAGSFCFVVAN